MDFSGRLTVKHFLYVALPKTINKVKKYPVYVRVSLDKKQYDFKSDFQSFLTDKSQLSQEELKLKGYYTTKEFEKIEAISKSGEGEAIESERKIIWEISDFLRLRGFNIVQKGAREMIDTLMLPIEQSLSKYCITELETALQNSQALEGKNVAIHKAIDWSVDFETIFTFLKAVSTDSIRSEVIEKLQVSFDTFNYLKAFASKLSHSESQKVLVVNESIMAYQWSYLNLENRFADYLRTQNVPADQIISMTKNISISLNQHILHLKDKNHANALFPIAIGTQKK